jgi:menaquinol-cytochrome c reductase iron-sulfur subunit
LFAAISNITSVGQRLQQKVKAALVLPKTLLLQQNRAMSTEATPPADPERREFMKKAAAVAIGSATLMIPLGAGLTVLFDPLRRKQEVREKTFITTLQSLPADGTPRKFAIIASRTDAWNRFPNAPVGAIYLRKTGENSVQALNVICPHAGCFVDFKSTLQKFYCPCHNSTFAVDGTIDDPKSPSPRGMDTLEVEIRHEHEVWVRFQNFATGHPQKIPLT